MAAIVAATAVVAFNIGRNSANEEVAMLEDKQKDFDKSQEDAAIVKRVSQQMEEIAYQQKAISDLQRDRAELQSQLAQKNALEAEKKSEEARRAEQQAKEALAEADVQRNNAVKQERIAMEQLQEARLQKSITDTLGYRTMGRTLGNSAQTKYEGGSQELASLLAYASWYFLDKYNGNPYITESFVAVSTVTQSQNQYHLTRQSAINATSMVPNSNDVIIVTGYGEIIKLRNSQGKISGKTLFSDKKYDFRDVRIASDGTIYALSFDGGICRITPSGTIITYQLVNSRNRRIICFHEKDIILSNDENLIWFNPETKREVVRHFNKQISTACQVKDKMEVFFTDGSYAHIDFKGNVKNLPTPFEGVITSALHDPNNSFSYYGRSDGAVRVRNKYGVSIDLVGHTSRITSMDVMGDLLICGSYDRELHIWNLPKLYFTQSNNIYSSNIFPTAVTEKKDNKKVTPTEWQVPTTFKYNAWPLAVCINKSDKTAWIGLSDGSANNICISADDMAKKLRNNLKRNFTRGEWEQYVGIGVPYVEFK